MTPIEYILTAPQGKAHNVDAFREQVGRTIPVLVEGEGEGEGVEHAELLAAAPAATPGWDVQLTLGLSDDLAARYRAGTVRLHINLTERPPGS